MNTDTRIGVHCYAGDAALVRAILPLHRRHECPITVLSPEDSAVEIPGECCRVGGKRQSVGPLAIARQQAHMKILLSYPEHFFLMHDADSLCLSAQFPQYLYQEPNVLWANLVYNPVPHEQEPYLVHKVPRIALQPPVWAARPVIERLLAVEESPMDGFIDHWFAQAATRAGVPIKGFQNGVSTPISTAPGYLDFAQVEARYKGASFFHSVKSARFWDPLMRAHQGWLTDGPDVTADMNQPDPLEYYRAEWDGDRMEYKEGLAT